MQSLSHTCCAAKCGCVRYVSGITHADFCDANGVRHYSRCALDHLELGGIDAGAPQWILPISGRWWAEAMDGMRAKMGPGELSLGEDQNCLEGREGCKGQCSDTAGAEPAVLMALQWRVPPVRRPCHTM